VIQRTRWGVGGPSGPSRRARTNERTTTGRKIENTKTGEGWGCWKCLSHSSTPSGGGNILSGVGSCPPFASTVPERGLCQGEIPVLLSYIMGEQTANTLPTERREGDCRGGGARCVGGTVRRVPEHQHANAAFASILILAVDSGRGRPSGPTEEVGKPREGVKGPFLIIVVVRDIGIVLGGGSKWIVVTLVEPVLVGGLCDHACWTLERIRGDVEGLVIGRVFIGRFAERVMETTGETDVVLLRPGGGEARYADGKRATGEMEPRGTRRRLGVLLPIVSMGGPEGIAIDGLTLEIGFVRGERVAGDPGNGGSEPRNLGDG